MQLQRFPLIILAFAIGGCSVPNDAELEQERTTSADAAIRSLPVDGWCKAEADRDIEAKMKLFTTDAVLMPPGNSDVIGQQAIRAWHEKMWQGTKYQCSGTIDEVQVFGDWGMVRGTFSGVFTPASGAPQSSNGRFLNTVQRQADGSWKIARGIWNSNLTGAAPDTRANDEQAIRDAEDVQMFEAAKAKDVERVLSFYADEALGFPPNAALISGKEEMGAFWSELVENPNLNWQTTKVEVSRSSDLAYSFGTYGLTMSSAEGEPLDDHGKWVVVWKKQPDGTWAHIIDIFNSDVPLSSASTP